MGAARWEEYRCKNSGAVPINSVTSHRASAHDSGCAPGDASDNNLLIAADLIHGDAWWSSMVWQDPGIASFRNRTDRAAHPALFPAIAFHDCETNQTCFIAGRPKLPIWIHRATIFFSCDAPRLGDDVFRLSLAPIFQYGMTNATAPA